MLDRPASLRRMLPTVVLGLIGWVAGCGSGGSSGAPRPATGLCAAGPIVHEYQFADDPALRASFDGVTIVHMETPGAVVDRRDSASPGIDRIPYRAERAQTIALHVGPGAVAHARLLDANGTTLAMVPRGAAAVTVPVAAGEYAVELTGDGRHEGIVFMTPEACASGAAQSALLDAAQQTTSEYVHPGVYIQQLPSLNTIVPVTTGVAAFIGGVEQGPIGSARPIETLGAFTTTFGDAQFRSPLGLAVAQFLGNGGSLAYVVGAPASAAGMADAEDLIGDLAAGTGLYALRGNGDVELIAIPDLAGLSESDAATVVSAAVPFAVEQGAILIVDSPVTLASADALLAWAAPIREALDTTGLANTAMYFPPLDVTPPLAGSLAVTTGVSGTATGVYAAVGANSGVWVAPSGADERLDGATPVASVDESTASTLLTAGINPVRTFPSIGTIFVADVSWAGPTAPSIADRRLTRLIERSVRGGLTWVVFEPSGPLLWAAVTSQVSMFLNSLWQQGALLGATEAEAYTVTCDITNNPPPVILNGYLQVDVSFTPIDGRGPVLLSFTFQVAAPEPG